MKSKQEIDECYSKAKEPFAKFKYLTQQLFKDDDMKSEKSDSEWDGEEYVSTWQCGSTFGHSNLYLKTI